MSTKHSPNEPSTARDLRSKLVSAALEILAEPESELGLRSACRRIGRSQFAAYTAFGKGEEGGLSGLLAAVAAEGFRRLAAMIAGARQGKRGAAVEVMAAVSTAYLEFAELNPRLYRLMFGERLRGKLHLQDLLAARLQAEGVLHTVIADVQGEGVGFDPDSRHDALCVWALMHGLAQLRLDSQLELIPGLQDRASSAQYAAQFLINGLKGG